MEEQAPWKNGQRTDGHNDNRQVFEELAGSKGLLFFNTQKRDPGNLRETAIFPRLAPDERMSKLPTVTKKKGRTHTREVTDEVMRLCGKRLLFSQRKRRQGPGRGEHGAGGSGDGDR